MGLESERVIIRKKPSYELWSQLTEEEKEFLLGSPSPYYHTWYEGKRVELNAMTTDQLISWLEGKLQSLGLQSKVLPPEEVVEKELANEIDEKLSNDVGELLIKTIEELIGMTIEDAVDYIKQQIGAPATRGYYHELQEFLKGCPPEYWRDWLQVKANELEREHIKSEKKTVKTFLVGRLNKGKEDVEGEDEWDI